MAAVHWDLAATQQAHDSQIHTALLRAVLLTGQALLLLAIMKEIVGELEN